MVVGYISVLLLLVIVIEKGYAQGGEIMWGKPFEDIKLDDAIFLKKDPVTKYTYWFTTSKGKNYITVFDSNSVKIESKLISFPKYKGGDVSTLPCAVVKLLKDKILFIFQYYDKKINIMDELIVSVLFNGETSDIIQFNQFAYQEGKTLGNISLQLTPDSSQFIVSARFPIQKKIPRAKCTVGVYNTGTLKLVHSGEYVLPEEYEFCGDDNYVVMDKAGNIFTLGHKIIPISRRRDSASYNIVKLNVNSEFTDELPLEGLSGKKVKDIGLKINRQGDITVSGFYEDYNSIRSRNYYSGIFMGVVKPNEPVQVKITTFTNEEKLTRTSPDLLLKTVNYIAKDDGGVILLSEQQIIDHSNVRYGNILIVDLDKDGTVRFAKTLLKDQVSLYGLRNGNFYSYYHNYLSSKKKLFIVYNDNPLGATENSFAYQMTPVGSVPVLAVVDSNGVLTKSRIKLNAYQIVCPLLTSAVSDSEYVVKGRKDYEVRLGTLKISETIIPSLQVTLPTDTVKAKKRYGFRFSGSDIFVKPKIFTGLNVVAVKSCLRKSNGISIGLLGNKDSTCNGIAYGTFASIPNKMNGISMSWCIAGGKKTNGLAIGGLGAASKTMNGIAIGGFLAGGGNVNGVAIGGFAAGAGGTFKGLAVGGIVFAKQMSGVAISGIYTNTDSLAGVTISGINHSKEQKGLAVGGINIAKELHGIQLGALNYARNNPWPFRLLPLVNVHLGK